MLRSHSFSWADFDTSWYKRWARELLQDEENRQDYDVHSNKFWQNAAIAQTLWERGAMIAGANGIGFGVGQERLPALFAKYDVDVTATDQDFTTDKAEHWAEHKLASDAQSLNKLGICDPKKFITHITYDSVDMNKVPKQLHGLYDFMWSNCALGHLGSISNGQRFIEQSLKCLKPGGWAVHTTELNILSNIDTVTDGDTVIFRLEDIYQLHSKLSEQGYIVTPFRLTMGNRAEDTRISLVPEFGNNYTKLQFRGHLLTQIILIIQKPKKLRKHVLGVDRLVARRIYKRNLKALARYRQSDVSLRQMQLSKKADISSIKIKAIKSHMHFKIYQGASRSIWLSYTNKSEISLFGVFTEISPKPVRLATANPVNRQSIFANTSWLSDNRADDGLWLRPTRGEQKRAESIPPGANFSYKLTLSTKRIKKGKYTESFCVVQEQVGVVEGSEIRIDVEVA